MSKLADGIQVAVLSPHILLEKKCFTGNKWCYLNQYHGIANNVYSLTLSQMLYFAWLLLKWMLFVKLC